jgi:hypothetical protein
VADTNPGTTIPYMLTANHCFSSQASATSLIAYFDYRSSVCNGPPPSTASCPKVFGSTLLATSALSDFTFVELTGNPSGDNYYLGWTETAPSHGQEMHRIAHPAGTAQKYSRGTFLAYGGITCGSWPRPHFHYSQAVEGSTTGGSSGSPVIIDASGGQIVGQLKGVCYTAGYDDCNYNTYNWGDGAFGTTFPYISEWLQVEEVPFFEDGFETGDTSGWAAATP